MPDKESHKPTPLAPSVAGGVAGLIATGEVEGVIVGAVAGFGAWYLFEKVDLPGPLSEWQRQVRGTLPSEDRAQEKP